MLREVFNEIVVEKEVEVKLLEDSNCIEDLSLCFSVFEMNEDGNRKENNCVKDFRSQLFIGILILVDKEINIDEVVNDNMVVCFKECSSLSFRQYFFVRSSVIVCLQIFFLGEWSQYICRLNWSDSDSLILVKKLLFVRNFIECCSLRVKRMVCQLVFRRIV